MNVSAKLPDDDPLMIAWNAYKQTKEYDNVLRWAKNFTITVAYDTGQLIMNANTQEGSLWAAYAEGFKAGRALNATPDPTSGNPDGQ